MLSFIDYMRKEPVCVAPFCLSRLRPFSKINSEVKKKMFKVGFENLLIKVELDNHGVMLLP